MKRTNSGIRSWARPAKRLGVLVATGGIAVAVAACGSSGDDTATAGGSGSGGGGKPLKTLVVGAATGQTGFLATFDRAWLKGFQLGVKEINDKGGIGGKVKIDVRSVDTGSEAARTSQAVRDLLGNGANVIVTPTSQDLSVGGGTLAQRAHVPAFSAASSQPQIPPAVGNDMFLVSQTDNAAATLLAQHAIKKGYRNAYLISSPGTTYTRTWPQFFQTVFTKGGGKISGSSSVGMDETDFSTLVTKIKSQQPQPDVIMTSLFEPAFPAFIKQLRSAGVTTPVLGDDALDSPTIYALGKAAEGVTFVSPAFAAPGSPLSDFYTKIAKQDGPQYAFVFSALGYDLAKILDAAVQQSGYQDGDALRDAIAKLKDVAGVTSPITYNGGNTPIRTMYVVQIHDGKPRLLSQGTPAAADVPGL
jgi:branched-chain amino acid transport system substrate-binding protein